MEFNEGNAIVFHGSKLPLEKKEFTLNLDVGQDDAIVEITLSTAVSYTHLTLPTICSV